MQSVPDSEEKIQILCTGDFADGSSVKLDEINKQLCEKMGINVEFLTGDVHVSTFAARMRENAAKEEERRKAFAESLRAPLDKAIGALLTKAKRMGAGLYGDHRAKNIRAMRAGKYTMRRTSPETRARQRESAKEIAWIPKDMRTTWQLW